MMTRVLWRVCVCMDMFSATRPRLLIGRKATGCFGQFLTP